MAGVQAPLPKFFFFLFKKLIFFGHWLKYTLQVGIFFLSIFRELRCGWPPSWIFFKGGSIGILVKIFKVSKRLSFTKFIVKIDLLAIN